MYINTHSTIWTKRVGAGELKCVCFCYLRRIITATIKRLNSRTQYVIVLCECACAAIRLHKSMWLKTHDRLMIKSALLGRANMSTAHQVTWWEIHSNRIKNAKLILILLFTFPIGELFNWIAGCTRCDSFGKHFHLNVYHEKKQVWIKKTSVQLNNSYHRIFEWRHFSINWSFEMWTIHSTS